jgi:regulator of protease activity HflC (stomatin/prohibitin superfamily)
MRIFKTLAVLGTALLLAACGSRVEVPPAHVGKILTKDGYQEAIIPPSKFRLDWCMVYCDKLVLLNVGDQAKTEAIEIFMPSDKLNMRVDVRLTLGLDPRKTEPLFSALPSVPLEKSDDTSIIEWNKIYTTYAQQIALAETREYLSKLSISEVASSLEKVTSDLRDTLTKRLQERTPFVVRYVGITDIKYPDIITKAQENAATRREQIQQEEAQLEISKVSLERELQEARLQRQIEVERAQTEASAQRIQREVVDEKVLALRKLENQRMWIEKWDGKLPTMVTGENANLLMQLPQK